MNTHKNARLTWHQRMEMAAEADRSGICAAANAFRVSRRTCAKWCHRYRFGSQDSLADRSSRPHKTRRQLSPEQIALLIELRQARKTMRECAAKAGCSPSAAYRFLRQEGLGRLPSVEAKPPPNRYEHAAPGDMLHLDIKKLGRIVRPGHRITGDPRDSFDGAGYESIHVAIDDHSRISFARAYPDESKESTIDFLRAAVAFYASLGVRITRLLTDNGPAYRSKAFAAECKTLGLKHRTTRPYTPRTNGKAERFIQTALREWAYAHRYQNSAERIAALGPWLHRYNVHRSHSALGYRPPVSRLPVTNLSKLNS